MEPRRTWWPYGALAAEVLLFYRLVLFAPGYAIPWDLRSYHFPLASFIAKSLSRGELPLWDPYTYCGTPFYANIQAQLFYPPTWIAILASNALAPGRLLYMLELQIIGHVLLAGVCAYWLLRRLGLAPAAATTGATVYQLGAFFASQTEHLGAADAAAWLPLACWGVVALSQNPQPVYVAALACAFGMSLLAGMPAVAAVVLSGALLVALAYIAFREASAKLLVYVAGAAAWGFLLAAVQLLPTLELTRLSVAQYRSDFMAGHGGLPLQSLISLVLPNHYSVFDLSHFSLPYDPTHLYTYCGIVGLALAAIGATRRSRVAWIFLSVTVVAAFTMLGEFTRAGKLALTILPRAVQSVVYPEEFLALFTMGLAVLAGLGSQKFSRGVLGYALLAVTAADCIAVSSSRPMNTISTQREPGVSYEQFHGNRELLPRIRTLTGQTVPPARIDTVDDSLDWASAAPLTEIPTANGNDPLALARYMQVRLSLVRNGARWGRYYQVSIPESPVLSLLNVRYLLSRTPVSSAAVFQTGGVPGSAVYENPRVLPRFFLVNRIERVADADRKGERALAILRLARFRPEGFAVVEGAPPFENQNELGANPPVRVLLYTPRLVLIQTEAQRPAYLVTSETYYPGWHAYVDGEEQRLFPTDVAFRGLPVPAGRHRIEMRFAPSILWRGLGITAIAGLGLIGIVAFSKRR